MQAPLAMKSSQLFIQPLFHALQGLPAMTGSLSVITNERGGVIDDTLARHLRTSSLHKKLHEEVALQRISLLQIEWNSSLCALWENVAKVTKCSSKEHGEHVYQAESWGEGLKSSIIWNQTIKLWNYACTTVYLMYSMNIAIGF